MLHLGIYPVVLETGRSVTLIIYNAVLYIIGAGLFIIGPNLAIFSDILAIFSDIQRFFYRISLSIVPIIKKSVWGWLYGTRMETNVFVFTLFFLFPSLFSWYDIVQVPTNLGSKYSDFFLRERIFCEIYKSKKHSIWLVSIWMVR